MCDHFTVVDEDVVRDVARSVVAQAAPAEMVMFGMNSRAYFQDPAGTLETATGEGGQAKESPLGAAGAGAEVVVLLTPFALAMVQGVLASLLEKYAANLADQSGAAVRRWLGSLFRRSGGAEPAADDGTGPVDSGLTPDQAEPMREEAYRMLLRYGLDEAQARLLADVLAGLARVRR
ncbi:hypothetical protein [Streptomyces sp. NPDC054834]